MKAFALESLQRDPTMEEHKVWPPIRDPTMRRGSAIETAPSDSTTEWDAGVFELQAPNCFAFRSDVAMGIDPVQATV